MAHRLIILIGPIGSGKGTQADILAEKFGLSHFETSKFLEKRFEDPKLADQKKLWAAGILNDPKWVSEVVIEGVKKVVDSDKGLVLSSSPRTLFEVEHEMPVFEDIFGKENIIVFEIDLSEGESIKRNSGRRICQANRHPIPNFPEFRSLTVCPKDGSLLITRVLDSPDVIKVRYNEYLTRTEPIFAYLSNRGYSINKINGEQPIEKVAEDILGHISM